MRDRAGRDRGVLLLSAVVLILFLSLITPILIRHLSQESRWSVKQQRTTTAFNLAEAGLERGIWKLGQDTANWDNAAAGVAIPGFNNDTPYSDVNGGLYKVQFSPGPQFGTVTVLARGRDTSRNEDRAIRAVLFRGGTEYGMISTGGLSHAVDFHVHWGPLVSYDAILVSSVAALSGVAVNANNRYPRKFAKGPVYNRDSDPNFPNSDGIEY